MNSASTLSHQSMTMRVQAEDSDDESESEEDESAGADPNAAAQEGRRQGEELEYMRQTNAQGSEQDGLEEDGGKDGGNNCADIGIGTTNKRLCIPVSATVASDH